MSRHIDPELSNPSVAIYEAIRQAWDEFGFPPTQRELIEATGYSITTVLNALRVLKDKGYITRKKFETRSARPTDVTRLLLNEEPPPWDAEREPPRYWARGTGSPSPARAAS